MTKPIICAHAGGAAFGPENSIGAVRGSLNHLSEQDLIEFDVQETRDGILVLDHGSAMDSLDFALGFSGKLKDYTLQELREINPNIATMEEVLREIGDRCGIVIDLKDPNISLEKLKKLVNKNHKGKVYFTAANSDKLVEARAEVPEWDRIAQCRTTTSGQLAKAVELYDPAIIDVWPPFLTPAKIQEITRLGLGFVPGGMSGPLRNMGEDEDRIRQWARAGATFILTFNPERARQFID